MNLKGAFDCFDLNSDGIISKNEFFYGINSLELGFYFSVILFFIKGLTNFEINYLLNILDLDKNGSLT